MKLIHFISKVFWPRLFYLNFLAHGREKIFFCEIKILLPVENTEENSAIRSTDIQTSQRFLGNISIAETFGFEIPGLNFGVHGNPKKLM